MGQERGTEFTPKQYRVAARVIGSAIKAEPDINAPTGADIGNALAQIEQAQTNPVVDMRFSLADTETALAVYTSQNPTRQNLKEPDRILSWLENQQTYALERVLLQTRRPLKESLDHYINLVLGATGKIGKELFPPGNNPWNRTRREITGLAVGSLITVAIALNPQVYTDSVSRTTAMINQKCEPLVQLLIESGANTNSTPKDVLVGQCADMYYHEKYEEDNFSDPERWLRLGLALVFFGGIGTAGVSAISMSRRAMRGIGSLRRLEAAK